MRSVSTGILAALLAVSVWQARADDRKDEPRDGGKKGAPARHGEYLVTRVAMCVDCHTPRNARGEPDTTRHLQGGALAVKPVKEAGHWADKAPDITRSGLAGKWTEAQLVKLLMTGENPDGDNPHPPMPAYRLQEKDARAVAQYLRSLPGKKEGRKEKGK